jgi:hypothetical protein
VLSPLRIGTTRLLAWWIQWWWADALLATAIAIILRESLRPATGADLLGQLGLADRRAAYANMLQLTAIFAGFSGVGFAIYLGLGSRSVQQIKTSAGAPLLRVWIAALVTPWICTLVLVFCGITDRGGRGSANFTRWVAIAALAVVVLQLARIIWIFYQLALTDLEAAKPAAAVAHDEVRVIRHHASR